MPDPEPVVIAPPAALQRPGCPGGTPVLMADSRFWLVPVPGPGWAVPGVDPESLSRAAGQYADPPDRSRRNAALNLAFVLMRANYDLDADAFADHFGEPSPHLYRTLDAMLADQAAHAEAAEPEPEPAPEPEPFDGAHAATDFPTGAV